jgi:hypothetical protein
MTDFQKVIFIAALFGFGAVFIGNFVTNLPFIPDSLESYALVVAALVHFIVVAQIAKKIGIHFY